MLKNLEGISAEEIDADFIRTGKEVEPILNKGIAATAAGESGAINIWKDDDGWIRCEAMRWMRPVDKKGKVNMTLPKKHLSGGEDELANDLQKKLDLAINQVKEYLKGKRADDNQFDLFDEKANQEKEEKKKRAKKAEAV
jgi:hypothetical protein